MTHVRTTFLTLVNLACATSAAAQQLDNAGWTFVDVMGAPSGGPGGRVFVGDIDADRDPDMLDFGGNLWINGFYPPGPVSVVMQQLTHVPGTTTVPCVPTGFLSPSGVSFPFSDKGTFADMDLDGDPDFVMACVGFSAGQSFFRPVVFENLFPITPFQFVGGPSFAVGPPGLGEVSLPNGGFPTCVAVADLNLDLFPDVIMASNAGILVYANQLDPITGLRVLNNVTSAVASPSIGQFFARIVDIAVGDFDGDGDPDLAIATGLAQQPLGAPPSCVAINPGGFGPFVRGPVFTFVPQLYGQATIAIGDLNGTGPLDVVLGTGGAQSLYLDPPAAGPATRTPLPSGDFPLDVAIADIDGDARNDIVFANFPFLAGAGRHQLLVNTGGGTFVDATGARFGASEALISNLFEHLEVTDFDFDGDNDLVFSGSSFRLYRNRQLSVATTVATTGGGTQWTITNRLACDEGYNTGAGGGTGPISLAGLIMTIEPIVYIFPGPIPVPVVSGTWISAGIFQFNLALTNGVVTTVMSIPHNPLFVGTPLYMTALMASTYSNSLRIANVTETPFPP